MRAWLVAAGTRFDRLAAELASRGWRVICPDLVGRGQSDWLRNPEEYNLPQYAVDMTVLIARLGVSKVDYIGTSLGGLIGMVLAGQPDTPVSRLVVNDIGPFLPWQALHRLAASVRNSPNKFPSFAHVVAFYRQSLAPFGDLSDAEWEHLARYNVEELPDGSCRKYADPDITAAFKPGWYFNLSLWSSWDTITCPVLVLRHAVRPPPPRNRARDDAARAAGADRRDSALRPRAGPYGRRSESP